MLIVVERRAHLQFKIECGLFHVRLKHVITKVSTTVIRKVQGTNKTNISKLLKHSDITRPAITVIA